MSLDITKMIILKGRKFGIVAVILQVIFIILFGFLADYEELFPVKHDSEDNYESIYTLFKDIHVMVFVGLGFVMTFMKKYGYSAVSFNLLVASFVIQWATLIRGLLYGSIFEYKKFTIGIRNLLYGDYAAATVLISVGAVLGKTSPLQLLVMALIEVVLYLINEWIGHTYLIAEDVGGSMYIHAFGAYFGLAVSRVLYESDIKKSKNKDSVYHSDMFSMIGTLFLWVFWPSFNGGLVSGKQQTRAVVNTYLALTASAITTFAISAIANKRDKFQMLHVQNATLSGGVAIGTTANMPLGPWVALLIGSLAGVLSTIGYQFLTPQLIRKLGIHDSCGVHNLHGMPGLLAGFTSACTAALATYDKWGDNLFEIFHGMAPKMDSSAYMQFHLNTSIWDAGMERTSIEQGGYQMATLMLTVIIAVVGGIITGIILRIPIWNRPKRNELFDDEDFWDVAPNLEVDEGKHRENETVIRHKRIDELRSLGL